MEIPLLMRNYSGTKECGVFTYIQSIYTKVVTCKFVTVYYLCRNNMELIYKVCNFQDKLLINFLMGTLHYLYSCTGNIVTPR